MTRTKSENCRVARGTRGTPRTVFATVFDDLRVWTMGTGRFAALQAIRATPSWRLRPEIQSYDPIRRGGL